ncbi:MAG: glycoside hydrolase family 13 protein [Fusicatenibacter sp.]|nr:glycoside hydrolase family 13 protein [Fusicatenibacter sp.]
MNQAALYHGGTYPDVYAPDRYHLTFSFRAASGDIRSCHVIYFHKNHMEETRKEQELTLQYETGVSSVYTATVAFRKPARYVQYCFRLTGNDGETIWYHAWGPVKSYPLECYFEYAYANEVTVSQLPPVWSQGTVYYQIFPERFRNGDPSNDPKDCMPWGSTPTPSNFMGGDLAGIRKSLDYLASLGVECIYLNPVFRAPSNHKYDTTDYYTVDPQFGTNEDLRALVKEAHKRKIRVILDAVFNHTGTGFFAFADILKNQESSEYLEWYHITAFPVTEKPECYECFFGFEGMPKLDTGNGKVQEYLLKVLEFWVKEAGVDGYRYDVADELDENFVIKIRDRLKRLNPDLVLIGETWAEGKRLLNGCGMDSIMNYSFRQAMLDFFAERCIDAKELGVRLEMALSRHPAEINAAMFNALDTHDTERFIDSCSHRQSSFRLAVVTQILFPGSPSIYYGDEAGMDGKNDPDCRKCMMWDNRPGEQELFQFYRTLILLRKKHPAVRNGSFRTLTARERVYGFVRENEEEIIYVFVNDGNTDAEITEVLCGPVTLPAGGFRIICKKSETITENIYG